MAPNRVHTGISEDDLQRAGDGGIALLRRPYVVADRFEHG
jgi:hypothetical protein